MKKQVLIAHATGEPRVPIAFGDKQQERESFLVRLGIAEDDTPEGLAAAAPHVAVFEVAPA